jgi:hypothetical protein
MDNVDRNCFSVISPETMFQGRTAQIDMLSVIHPPQNFVLGGATKNNFVVHVFAESRQCSEAKNCGNSLNTPRGGVFFLI